MSGFLTQIICVSGGLYSKKLACPYRYMGPFVRSPSRARNVSEAAAFLSNEVSSGLIGESVRRDGSLQESGSSNIGSNMIGPLQNNI